MLVVDMPKGSYNDIKLANSGTVPNKNISLYPEINQYAGLKDSCAFCSHTGAMVGTQTIGVNQNHKFEKIDTNSFVSLKKTFANANIKPKATAKDCCKKNKKNIGSIRMRVNLPFKNKK